MYLNKKLLRSYKPTDFFMAALVFLGTAVHLFSANSEEPTPAAVTVVANAPYSVTGKNDIAWLKNLASGVGWEMNQTAETTSALRAIAIKTIRCINVDRIPGTFDASGRYVISAPPSRLNAHLETCRKIEARPHIIIAQNVPDALRLDKAEAKERLAIMGQTPGKSVYWNGNWPLLRAYWKELFRYVLIEKGFVDARFEVGNEPDIDGQFPKLIDGDGEKGSRKLYRSYFEIYKNASIAAREFETENPGVHVSLGGPGLAWAYTFQFGEGNWVLRFFQDCAEEHLKLDFIGIHYYGNISSFRGEYTASYPPFTRMLSDTLAARDRYEPGVPLIFTEWGPSYHTNNRPESLVNATPLGAAWSLEFLNTLLENKVDGAIYLLTTDFVQSAQTTVDPLGRNIWGWPSLFVNPTVFGKAWPKPPFHLFDLIHQLAPERVSVRLGSDTAVGVLAARDAKQHRLTLLLWNYRAQIPESAAAINLGKDQRILISISGAKKFFGANQTLQVKQWSLNENRANALGEYMQTQRITESSLLGEPSIEKISSNTPEVPVMLPSCGITYVSLELKPTVAK